MVKFNRTVATIATAGAVAIAAGIFIDNVAEEFSAKYALTATSAVAQSGPGLPRPQWAASATGRVEPKEGEVRISAQTAGEIKEVYVKANERVTAGDLLVRLDDSDALERLRSAEAEALVRHRERDEEDVTGLALERRQVEDALAAAERAAFKARVALDAASASRRAGGGTADAVAEARKRVTDAATKVAGQRDALSVVLAKANMPLPTRLDSSLTQARADVALAEAAVDRARARAPFDATVLSVQAKAGETAAPSPEVALLTLGDLSTLRVRAEVEDRDVTKVRVGQRAVIRADAFQDREFDGVVTSVAAGLGSPRISSRGPRRPNDVEVLEVVVTMEGAPPLLTGMRVDVFFKIDEAKESRVN